MELLSEGLAYHTCSTLEDVVRIAAFLATMGVFYLLYKVACRLIEAEIYYTETYWKRR